MIFWTVSFYLLRFFLFFFPFSIRISIRLRPYCMDLQSIESCTVSNMLLYLDLFEINIFQLQVFEIALFHTIPLQFGSFLFLAHESSLYESLWYFIMLYHILFVMVHIQAILFQPSGNRFYLSRYFYCTYVNLFCVHVIYKLT